MASMDGPALGSTQTWTGVEYPAEQFRSDVMGGVELVGEGSVADMLWARPAVTVLGMDVPPVVGSSAAIQSSAAARVSLRVPPGTEAQSAQEALIEHLRNYALAQR